MVQKSYALMKIKLIPRMKYLLGLRDNGRADSGEAGRHKKKSINICDIKWRRTLGRQRAKNMIKKITQAYENKLN